EGILTYPLTTSALEIELFGTENDKERCRKNTTFIKLIRRKFRNLVMEFPTHLFSVERKSFVVRRSSNNFQTAMWKIFHQIGGKIFPSSTNKFKNKIYN